MSKVLSWEDRQTRELEFVQKYVENGGNATDATVEIPQPVSPPVRPMHQAPRTQRKHR